MQRSMRPLSIEKQYRQRSKVTNKTEREFYVRDSMISTVKKYIDNEQYNREQLNSIISMWRAPVKVVSKNNLHSH